MENEIVTTEEVLEFQRLCKKYGFNLTLEEAEMQASRMVMFLESLAKSESDKLSLDLQVRKDKYGSK